MIVSKSSCKRIMAKHRCMHVAAKPAKKQALEYVVLIESYK